jgi:hypothetical protein
VVPLPDLRQASHARRTVEVNQLRIERRDFDEIFAAALAQAPAPPVPAKNPKSDTRNPKAAPGPVSAAPARAAAPPVALQAPPIQASMAETTVDNASSPAASLAPLSSAISAALIPRPAFRGVSRLAAAGIAIFSFFAGILLGLALR